MVAKVALVTGATRGVGRGVAVSLGAAGWTVWVTGRSSRSGRLTSHLPGTVEETAAAVTAAGGCGRAAVCDHRDDEQVRAVVARIAAESGTLATSAALAADGVASVALYPGLVRTEGVMQFAEHLDLTDSESPEGVGRVIAALAADDTMMSLTGNALTVSDLATRYEVDVAA